MRTDKRPLSSVVGLCLVLVGAGSVLSAAQVAVKIAPRDQLTVSVWNAGVKEESYSSKFPVDADGTFEYPTLGRVKVGGLTAREVEADLKTRLEKFLVSPQVIIEIEQTTTKKVVINGQVGTPGTIPFSGEMTLFEALTRAGSMTENAADEAVIYRTPPDGGAPKPIRVDLYELMNGGQLTNNLVLHDGDLVMVPKSEPVFVTGFVRSPGSVQVKRNTTVRQVVNMAGDLSDRGTWRGIKIQRTVNGKKTEVPVKNIDTDIVKPGDTVLVTSRIF